MSKWTIKKADNGTFYAISESGAKTQRATTKEFIYFLLGNSYFVNKYTDIIDDTGKAPAKDTTAAPKCVECDVFKRLFVNCKSYIACGDRISMDSYCNEELLKEYKGGCPKMAAPKPSQETPPVELAMNILEEMFEASKPSQPVPTGIFQGKTAEVYDAVKASSEADAICKGMAGVQAKPPIHIFTAKDSPADLVDAMKTCLDSGHGYTLERQDNGCVIMRKKAKASLPEEPCIERDFDGNCTGMCKEAGGKPETDTVKLTLGALIAGQKETDRRLDVLEKDKLNKDTQTQIDAIKERQNCILSEFKCFIEQFHALERAVKKLRKAVKRGKQVKK